MADAWVQSQGPNAGGSVSSASGLQGSAFGSSVTVGNVILVGIIDWDGLGGGLNSVTDNKGNTYTQKGSKQDGSGNSTAQIWSTTVTTGGTGLQITVKPSNSASVTFSAAEFSGLTTSLDGAGGSNAASYGTTPDAGTASTTNADDVLFAVLNAASTNNQTLTEPTGFTSAGVQNSTNSGAFEPGDISYDVVEATQTNLDPTWGGGVATGGDIYSALWLAFKATAATFAGEEDSCCVLTKYVW
jgi:hypothetical protein